VIRRVFTKTLPLVLALAMVLGTVPVAGAATSTTKRVASKSEPKASIRSRTELAAQAKRSQAAKRQAQSEREAAADRMKLQAAIVANSLKAGATASLVASQGGIPDYFADANWAFSPPLRKFVDELPGLGPDNANLLGQFIPVGHPDTVTYPGTDYYEIELRQYTEKMHSDLASTTLRGYVQVNNGTDPGTGLNTVLPDPGPHQLGPFIVAQRDKPVRVKFTNKLPTGQAGDLFIPVDTSVMGAGTGPLGSSVPTGMPVNYTENRATLHLHGGHNPWISDGTPHQWITPAGENTPYPKGVSVKNVPDMPDPGDGSQTFYYTNDQSARLMFYHDHSWGITRLNVYAGEAAGYMIQDPWEKDLVDRGVLPSATIPLIIQDKSFVDTATVLQTDPTWNWGTGTPDANGIRPPVAGDLWYPHVYSPAQNPADLSGMNAFGRWHYGPWFWPPTSGIQYPPVPNPYYDPINAPWEPEMNPGVPNPSIAGEAFMDTPIVNGTAFPKVTVEPKAYRLRILNAASDRFWNLQMYTSDTTTFSSDGRANTEVKMVPAAITSGFPETWPVDGRDGGVPDPLTAGPDWIQVGTEGGFLPKPAVIPQQPVTWNMDPTTFNFGNVDQHSLLLGSAERADVVVDFSAFPGQTLILYNDAPAAFPARDARLDYYTGSAVLTDTGGYWGTKVGFGPNTRTIMQINVSNTTPAAPFDLAALETAFASTATTQGVFEASQHPILYPDARYNSAYADTFTVDPYVRIFNTQKTFTTVAGNSVTIPFKTKAIQDEMGEAFDEFGRMSGRLGLQLPAPTTRQTFILQNFVDPSTEQVKVEMEPMAPVQGDGTQIWKITHNGVDTHPIHFHLYDVQLINRVGWDNGVRPPDDNELGWKDTIRVSPLEDTIVALRATLPKAPFGLPDSIRPLNPSEPIGSTMGFSGFDPYTGDPLPTPTVNQLVNYGWEYVWHCHILSHEEMDMMRPVSAEVGRGLAGAPALTATGTPGGTVSLTWTDATPWNGTGPASSFGNLTGEVGFRVERSTVVNGVPGAWATVRQALANQVSATDTGTVAGTAYAYRVVAYNAAGDSISNVVNIGTIIPPVLGGRVTGANQYAMAVNAAQIAFPGWTGVQHVVIAPGLSGFRADAVSAAGLAGAYNAPMLLTADQSLPTETRNALIAMPDGIQVHIVGGTSAVTNSVQTALGAVPGVASVDRVSGADRYGTAAAVATRMKAVLGAAFPTTALIASGSNSEDLYDALLAAPAANKAHTPLLLVQSTAVPASTASALTSLGLTRRILIGTTAKVSLSTGNALGVTAGNRLAGSNRYSQSVLVAQRALAEGWLTYTNVGIANQQSDALIGGAMIGKLGGPLLYTNGTTLPVETGNFLTANKIPIVNLYFFGSTANLSNAVMTAATTAAQ